MENRKVVPVQIDPDITVMVEVKSFGGEQDVSSKALSFRGVTDAIEGITKAIATTINKVQPDEATVELGLEVALKSGQLTALLVDSSQKGNLKITLEWKK